MAIGQEQIEGRNPVSEALLGRRRVARVMIALGSRGKVIDQIVSIAEKAGVPIVWAEREELDRLSKTGRHQGVLAHVEPYTYVELDDILANARRAGEDPLLLACAGVEDPQNLGSLLRVADAAGVHGVLIPRHRSAQLGPTVARASAGAIEHVSVARVTNLSRTLQFLKSNGIWAVAASPDSKLSYYDADLTGPLVIVVGSEGKGIPRLVAEHCDFAVSIPMKGRLNSLNVAVAGALLVFEALRQRRLGHGS